MTSMGAIDNRNHRGKSCKFSVKYWLWKPLDYAMYSEQLNPRNLAAQRWSVAQLVLNFIGAVIYVVRASNGWVIPHERELGLDSVTGEPYVWALSVFPICAASLC